MKMILRISLVSGLSLSLLSCSSSPDRYARDGSDLPGYSKNKFYGTIEFSRHDGLMYKSIDEMNFYYHNPGSYTSVSAEALTSNIAIQAILPFMIRPSIQTFPETDTLVQVKGMRGKDSLTFQIMKFNPNRPLTKIEVNLRAGYYHEKEKLWAAPVYPDLVWFDCGKKHRNEKFTIKPVSVFIEKWYDPDDKVINKVKEDAIKNSDLNIRLIDFEGCFKVVDSGGTEKNTVDAKKELPYIL